MGFIKGLFIVAFIYCLALVQASFLVHFAIFGFMPNILFIIFIIWNLIESPQKNFGLYMAIIAGFSLDIFSSHFIGFNIAILFLISLSIKFILKRYVRIPIAQIA